MAFGPAFFYMLTNQIIKASHFDAAMDLLS